jgi:uncharacterized RDD family membrane protein YckC
MARNLRDQRVSGVLIPRAAAYVVDFVVIAILAWVASIGVGILGVVTFGYGWMLWSVVWIVTAMAYAALTIGGRMQATFGMRACGLMVETSGGARPDGITAAAHCLLFYAAGFTIGLMIINVLFGVLRQDGRMGHDLLTGLIVLRN